MGDATLRAAHSNRASGWKNGTKSEKMIYKVGIHSRNRNIRTSFQVPTFLHPAK
jgi:hypothetical protein